MALTRVSALHTVSIAALDVTTYGATAACQKTVDLTYRATAVLSGPGQYEHRLANTPSFAERMSNLFYGVIQVDGTQLDLANIDQQLTFMRAEAVQGSMVRARRFDRISQEISEVATGKIDALSIGDSVSVTVVAHDLDGLSTPFPRNLIGVTGTVNTDGSVAASDEPEPNVLTTQFPRAKDVGTPINVVFGRTQVRCSNCNYEDEQSNFDYMVGEEDIEVESVQKIIENRLYESLSQVRQVTKVTVLALPNATKGYQSEVSFADWLQDDENLANHSMPTIAGRYDGWMKALTGTRKGEYFRIDSHAQPTPLSATITIMADASVAVGDLIQLQEWMPLINTVYKGRTAIRFNQKQENPILATVARYRPVKKNLLWDTDNFDPIPPTQTRPATSPYWFSYNVVASRDTSVLGPDDVTPTTKIVNSSTGLCMMEQTRTYDFSNTTLVFSVWIRTISAFALELFGNGASGTSRVMQYAAVGGPPVWRRVFVSKEAGWGTSPTTVTCRVRIDNPPGSFDAAVWIWGAQLEVGLATFKRDHTEINDGQGARWDASYYEPVGSTTQGARGWTFPDAIEELLRDSVWGLNGQVSAASFEDANRELFVGNTDTDWLFLKCQGSVPTISGVAGTGVDVLNQLLHIRGLRLRMEGNVWTLKTDCPGRPSQGTFGTKTTPYANCTTEGPVQIAGQADYPKITVVSYQQEMAEFSVGGANGEVRAHYPFKLRTTDTAATTNFVRELTLNFVRDHNTAARYLQYTVAALKLTRETVGLGLEQEGLDLRTGHLITYISPTDQAENRLMWNNNYTKTSWVNFETAMALNAGTDPKNENWRATSLNFYTGASYIEQDTGILASGASPVAVVWLRSNAAVNPIRLHLRNTGGGNDQYIDTVVGMGWKRVVLEASFAVGTTGNVFFRLTGNTSIILACDAQVTLDYEKPSNVATTDSRIIPNQLYRIAELSHPTVSSTSCTVTPYNSDQLFTYTKPVFPTRADTKKPTDPRILPPNSTIRTDNGEFGVTTPIPTLHTGVNGINTINGTSEAWAVVSFLMPSANADRVILQCRVHDEANWTDLATLNVATYGYGTPYVHTIHNLISNTEYDVRAVTYNAYGLAGSLDVLSYFTTL